MLQRAIEPTRTSTPTVKQSTKRLHENLCHYSGVHRKIIFLRPFFLAKNWKICILKSPKKYVNNFYLYWMKIMITPHGC